MGAGEADEGFWWGDMMIRAPGTLRHRCKNNIKMDLQEVGWGDVDWTELAQGTDR